MCVGSISKWSISTFVITTISSLGRLYFLMAFPRISSDSPFEYTFAVSKVWIPASYLYF